VRFCVKAKGKRYCRIVDIDLGTGKPTPPPDNTDDTAGPSPEPPQPPTPPPSKPTDPEKIPAPAYAAPDLDDPSLQGSVTDYTLAGTVGKDGGGRINPCEVLTWSVSGTEEEQELVRRMVTIWAERTGLAVREVPAPDFKPFVDQLPATSLPRDLDLPMMIIAWMDPSEVSYLSEGAIGVAKRRSMPGWAVVAVHIALSNKSLQGYQPERRAELLETVVLHELAHGAGLSHTLEPSQIMYPAVMSNSPSRYQRGDLAGLHEIARFRECLHVRSSSTPGSLAGLRPVDSHFHDLASELVLREPQRNAA
jgi:hypothetical protein